MSWFWKSYGTDSMSSRRVTFGKLNCGSAGMPISRSITLLFSPVPADEETVMVRTPGLWPVAERMFQETCCSVPEGTLAMVFVIRSPASLRVNPSGSATETAMLVSGWVLVLFTNARSVNGLGARYIWFAASTAAVPGSSPVAKARLKGASTLSTYGDSKSLSAPARPK